MATGFDVDETDQDTSWLTKFATRVDGSQSPQAASQDPNAWLSKFATRVDDSTAKQPVQQEALQESPAWLTQYATRADDVTQPVSQQPAAISQQQQQQHVGEQQQQQTQADSQSQSQYGYTPSVMADARKLADSEDWRNDIYTQAINYADKSPEEKQAFLNMVKMHAINTNKDKGFWTRMGETIQHSADKTGKAISRLLGNDASPTMTEYGDLLTKRDSLNQDLENLQKYDTSETYASSGLKLKELKGVGFGGVSASPMDNKKIGDMIAEKQEQLDAINEDLSKPKYESSRKQMQLAVNLEGALNAGNPDENYYFPKRWALGGAGLAMDIVGSGANPLVMGGVAASDRYDQAIGEGDDPQTAYKKAVVTGGLSAGSMSAAVPLGKFVGGATGKFGGKLLGDAAETVGGRLAQVGAEYTGGVTAETIPFALHPAIETGMETGSLSDAWNTFKDAYGNNILGIAALKLPHLAEGLSGSIVRSSKSGDTYTRSQMQEGLENAGIPKEEAQKIVSQTSAADRNATLAMAKQIAETHPEVATQEAQPSSELASQAEPTQKPSARDPYEASARRYAEEKGYDPDAFLEQARMTHEAMEGTTVDRQAAKKRAHDLMDLSAKDVSDIANSGFDYSSGEKMPGRRGEKMARFDEKADQIVKEFPEVFGNAENPYQAVWDLLQEKRKLKKLRVDDPEVLAEAEAAMQRPVDTSFEPSGFKPFTEGEEAPPPPGRFDKTKETFEQWREGGRELERGGPEAFRRIQDRLELDPERTPTPKENAVIERGLNESHGDRDFFRDQYKKARDAGDIEAMEQASRAHASANENFESTLETADKAGTTAARALVSQKLTAAEAFSHRDLVEEFTRNNNRAPTIEEDIALERQASEIAKADVAVSEAQSNQRLQDEIDRVQAPQKKPVKKPVVSENQTAVNAKIDAAWERFNKAATGSQSTLSMGGFGNASEMIAAAKDLAVAYIEKGALTASEFIADLKSRRSLSGDQEKLLEQAFNDAREKLKPEDFQDSESIAKYARKFLKSLVDSGVTDRESILDAAQERLREIDPNISRRDTRDAMTGYGKFKEMNEQQVRSEHSRILGELRKTSELEDVTAGKDTKKSIYKQKQLTDEEVRLSHEIKLKRLENTIESLKRGDIPPGREKTSMAPTEIESMISDMQREKTRLQNILKRESEYRRRITEQDFEPKDRREYRETSAVAEARARADKLKREVIEQEAKQKEAQKELSQKVMEFFPKWHRAAVLSYQSTIGKIGFASLAKLVTDPMEEASGGLWSKVVPKQILSEAPVEGGFNARAIARSLLNMFSKSGGDPPHEALTVMNAPGHIHQMLHSPPRRAAYARTFEKLMDEAASRGVDIRDPLKQAEFAAKAYQSAERAAFMQDNALVSGYNAFVKTTASQIAKLSPVKAKAFESAMSYEFPIIKVPTNIASEALQYTLGVATGLTKIAIAKRSEYKNLKPGEAELIMRSLKKGSFGALGLTLGFLYPKNVGGFYTPGEKRRKDDAPSGGFSILGFNFKLHHPISIPFQVGSTIRRILDYVIGRGGGKLDAVRVAFANSILGIAESTPFVNEVFNLHKIRDPNSQMDYVGEAVSGMIPGFVKEIGKGQGLITSRVPGVKTGLGDVDEQGNTIPRKSSGILQKIQEGIPVWRRYLPEKFVPATGSDVADIKLDRYSAEHPGEEIEIPKPPKQEGMDQSTYEDFVKTSRSVFKQAYEQGPVKIDSNAKATQSEARYIKDLHTEAQRLVKEDMKNLNVRDISMVARNAANNVLAKWATAASVSLDPGKFKSMQQFREARESVMDSVEGLRNLGVSRAQLSRVLTMKLQKSGSSDRTIIDRINDLMTNLRRGNKPPVQRLSQFAGAGS